MKTTLQIRLISFLIASSLFLIGTFTTIQLNNQIQKTREFDIYQARQDAFLVRDKVESVFSTYDEKTSRSILIDEVKNVFKTVLEGSVIQTVSLLDKDGYPIILEGDLRLFFEDDKSFIAEVAKSGERTKWIKPSVDKKHKVISLFITFNNPSGYILKLTFSLANIQKALNAVYVPIMVTVLLVITGNVLLGVLLSWALILPIKILNRATKDVAAGNLDLRIHINTKDELEELSNTFNYMTVELKKMKAKAENANPLTKLPGNIIIQEEVEKRINAGENFALIYFDLDHFKAFNDKYGVHAGDNAIMLTMDILKESIAKEGKGDDFIGHEGGDDFLLLTISERVDRIADYVIKEFDKRIRALYADDDLKNGYIETRGRESDQLLKFPIMTISLAGVSNAKKDINSYAQLTNIAAEVKSAAKKIAGSKFVMDRRIEDLGPSGKKTRI